MAAYRFPSNIDDYDQILIEIYDKNMSSPIHRISMFRPLGLQFGDSGSYNSFDMGIFKGVTDANGISNAAEKFGRDKEAAGVVVSKAISDAAGLGVIEQGRQASNVNKGIAVNPNSVMQFVNSDIRSFTFAWKIMPSTLDESRQFTLIEKTLRKYMYPAKSDSDYLLDFPARFKITIVQAQNGVGGAAGIHGGSGLRDIASGACKFYPLISESYLSSMSVSYNPNSNMSFESGAPAELDMTLTFQETNALSREFMDLDLARFGAF